MRLRMAFACGVAVIGLAASTAAAAPAPIQVDLVFQKKVSGVTYTCGGPVSGSYVPGALDGAGAFVPTSALISDLRQRIKKAKGQAKIRLQRTLAAARGYLKNGAPICKSGPGPNPTPTPRPTCFNSSGETGCFGIPAGVAGNKNRGASLFSSKCGMCHGSMPAKSYSQLNSAMSISDMRGISLNQQGLADITAYLNRSTP